MGSTRPFGNIRKLKSGRYQARYWHLGKQVPADTTFATKADARAWLATMETDLLGGRHVNPSSGRERFGDFAARWLEARDLRPRTRDTYASQLAHILAEFESVELRKITPSVVRAWHGRLAKSDLHANTVAKVYRLFRTMMDTAVDDGLIRMNPVHIKGAAVERAVERPPLDWDDVERIGEAIHPRFSAPSSGARARRSARRNRRPRIAPSASRPARPRSSPATSRRSSGTTRTPSSSPRSRAARSSIATLLRTGSGPCETSTSMSRRASTTCATSPGRQRRRPAPRFARSWRGWATPPPTQRWQPIRRLFGLRADGASIAERSSCGASSTSKRREDTSRPWASCAAPRQRRRAAFGKRSSMCS